MKTITRSEVIALRKQGLTYQKIGELFNVNKSIVWKLVNQNIAEMKIGNKSPVASRPITKIWELVDAQEFLEMIGRLTRSIYSLKEEVTDYLFRFYYSRNESFLSKLSNIPPQNRVGFLFECGKLEILHFYSHEAKKKVRFNIDKYDNSYKKTF